MENFEISLKIQQIQDSVSKNKNKFKVTGETQFPIDSDRIVRALIKLCKLWNKHQGSRNFVCNLINHFLPFNASQKVEEFDNPSEAHDAILQDVELAGTDEIMEICNKFSKVREYSDYLAVQQKANDDYESFEEREDNLREWIRDQPYKIIHADFGYYALNYNRYLCRESISALKYFVTFAIKLQEQQIMALMANKEHKILKRAKKTLGGNIENSGDIYAAFRPIK